MAVDSRRWICILFNSISLLTVSQLRAAIEFGRAPHCTYPYPESLAKISGQSSRFRALAARWRQAGEPGRHQAAGGGLTDPGQAVFEPVSQKEGNFEMSYSQSQG
eukprot:5177391-Pleurochrysis_carterae.AAC.1